MKKILLIFAVIAFLVPVKVQSQHSKYNKLPRVLIVEKDFLPILDSLIMFEKAHCKYYKKELYFLVAINAVKEDSCFKIELSSLLDTNVVQNLSPKGYCIYKNHYFFFSGILPLEFLKKEEKTKKFFYTDDIHLLNLVENDSFTMKFYTYRKGHFVFDSWRTSCN